MRVVHCVDGRFIICASRLWFLGMEMWLRIRLSRMGIGMGIGMGPRMKMRDGRLGRSLRFGGGNSFTWFDGDGYGLLFLFFFFFFFGIFMIPTA